mgnify:CR=1 FL=1
MKGAAMIVAIRSRLSGMTRVAIMPGTAQAKPEINGITDCPESPAARMARSIRKAVRAK